MPERCVLILLDGLADHSQPELEHRTPLQAARTPALDGLAAAGACGTYHPTRVGQALPSELAHFALFGYDPGALPGRGVLEALGAGAALDAGDVALMARLAHIEAQRGAFVLVHDRPGLSADEADALARAVGAFETRGVRIRFCPSAPGAGALVLKGPVSDRVTDTHPQARGRPLATPRPWAGFEHDPAARRTAGVVKEYLVWAHRRLAAHPVNRRRRAEGKPPATGWLTQRAGRFRPGEPFNRRYGLRGLLVASGNLYLGLGRYLGLEVTRVRDTADPGRDLEERLGIARDALGAYEFVHVHTKAPDGAGHAKDPRAKVRVIEALDRALGRAGASLAADPGVLLVVTSDHATPSSGPLLHSGETVPVLLRGTGVRRDPVEHFDEVSAAGGSLGLLRGAELFGLILTHLGRARLAGLREAPEVPPFWPAPYEPFRTEDGDAGG